jgi:hypothetical protein
VLQAADNVQRRKVVGLATATAFGIAAGAQTTEGVAYAESSDPEIMTISTTAGDMVFEFWPEVSPKEREKVVVEKRACTRVDAHESVGCVCRSLPTTSSLSRSWPSRASSTGRYYLRVSINPMCMCKYPSRRFSPLAFAAQHSNQNSRLPVTKWYI